MAARTVLLFFVVSIGRRLIEGSAVTADPVKEDAEFIEMAKKTVQLLHPVSTETSSSSQLSTDLKGHLPTATDKVMTAPEGTFQLNGRDNLYTASRQTEQIPRTQSTTKSYPHDPTAHTALPRAPGSTSIMFDSNSAPANNGRSVDSRSHDQPVPHLEAGVDVLADGTHGHSERAAVSKGGLSGSRCRRRRSWLWNQFFVIEEYRGPEPVLIGRLHTDTDRGDGRTKYALEGEGVGSVFVIDSRTGNIHVTKSLDREEKDQYRLIATAKDSLTGRALEPSSEFIIRVQDINDNPPVFPSEPYIAVVPEMANIGTSIIQVTARDADDPTYGNSARLVYAITQGQEYFSVDSQTGILRTAVADMDRETQEEYLVVLQARDMGGHLGGLTGTTTVTVKLSDVNDNPPHFRRSAWSFSISELAAPGVEVGRLTASDQDQGENAQLEFTIVDNDHGDTFNVTGRDREAVIVLNKLLDYETRSSYSFSVEVSNSVVDPRYIRRGPFKDIAAVRVMVLNADEPPRFSRARYRLDVSENCPVICSVGRISAVDPDTGQSANIRYSIDPQSDPEALFRIASDTGFISAAAELDREREQWHNITVMATQRDNPNLVMRVVVAIETLDQNDNAPELDRHYTTSVCDSSAPGQVVQVLRATDRDQGGHDTPVHFSISPESSSALNLTVRSNGDMTASLVLKSSLEPRPGYSPSLLSLYVPVVLRDGASGLTNTGTVTVVVCPCVSGGMQTDGGGGGSRQTDRPWERHAVCLPRLSASPSLIVSMFTLLALLACVTTVLVVCALSLSLRHQKHDTHPASEEDDVRENIIFYNDEGGGEADTAAFDMAALQSMQRHGNIWHTQQHPPGARTYSWSLPSPDPQHRPGSAPVYGRLCYGLHTLPVLRDYPEGPLEAGLHLGTRLNYGTHGVGVAGTLLTSPEPTAAPGPSAGVNLGRDEEDSVADCRPTDTNTCRGETCDARKNQDQTEPPDTRLTLTNEAAALTFCDAIECSSQSHTSSSSSQPEGRPGLSQTQSISSGASGSETDSSVTAQRNSSGHSQSATNPAGHLIGDTYSVVGSLNRSSLVPPGAHGLYPGGLKHLNSAHKLGRNHLSAPSPAPPLRMEDFLNYRLERVTLDLTQPPYDSLQTYEFEGRDSRADSLSSLESGGREEKEKEEKEAVVVEVGGMEELNQKFQRLVEIIKERGEEKEREAAQGSRDTGAVEEAHRQKGLRWDF